MKRLKELRERAHVTQEELAKILGVSRTAVTMWETGANITPTKYLLRIADALNCSVEDLLTEPTI